MCVSPKALPFTGDDADDEPNRFKDRRWRKGGLVCERGRDNVTWGTDIGRAVGSSCCSEGELASVEEPVRAVGETGKYEETARGLPAESAV